jgi:hypothetical protein
MQSLLKLLNTLQTRGSWELGGGISYAPARCFSLPARSGESIAAWSPPSLASNEHLLGDILLLFQLFSSQLSLKFLHGGIVLNGVAGFVVAVLRVNNIVKCLKDGLVLATTSIGGRSRAYACETNKVIPASLTPAKPW